MNTAKLHIHAETGQEIDNEVIPSNHQYNLRPRPTNRNPKYALPQISNQHTIPKPHVNVMMMQMNVREGIEKLEQGQSSITERTKSIRQTSGPIAKDKRRNVL